MRRTIFENARTVIFEINERCPSFRGLNGSHRVHLSEATYVVEGVHEPLPLRTYKDPSPVDIQIARNVVAEIPDGAVLGAGRRRRSLHCGQDAGGIRPEGLGLLDRHYQRCLPGDPQGGKADQRPQGGGYRLLYLEPGDGLSGAV